MSGDKGFGSDLWRQVQKVRIEPDGTFRAPVTADGKEGIVVGDPPLDPLGTAHPKRRGLVTRLRVLLRR